MKTYFDHEKLDVYQASIEFVTWANELLEQLPKRLSVADQLDRASTSIPLNIAEGNGKYTSADRCRFWDIARGSALECAACLDVLVAKKKIDNANEGKEILEPEDVAETVFWVTSLPGHVNVNRLEVMSTCQAWVGMGFGC